MSPQPPTFDNPALRKDIRVLPAITLSGVFAFSLQSSSPFFLSFVEERGQVLQNIN